MVHNAYDMNHMLYVSWLDLLIVLFLVLFVWLLRKTGLLSHLLMIGGFFIGLFVGGWLFPHILAIHSANLKVLINENAVLLFAVIVGIAGSSLGNSLDYRFTKKFPKTLATAVTVIVNLGFGLILVWLVTAAIGRLPFEDLSNSANDSLIAQFLDEHLPPIPALFSVFNRAVNPNNPSEDFIRINNQLEEYQPISSPTLDAAVNKDENSVVRITSFGCGSILTGSGFVAGPNLVITNAHVIAGAHRPIVKYGRQSYAGTVVLFDPNLDIAAIRVTGLDAPALTFDKQLLPDGTPIAALGYPGGNYTVMSGEVRDEQILYGSNIYNAGYFGRAIYEVQAAIEEGSSGSPMIIKNGEVAGVVFARSTAVNNDGFALDSQNLLAIVAKAKESTRKVGTGVCVSS
jgi:S1-C subfamily serine protease